MMASTTPLFPYQLEAATQLAAKKSQLLFYEMGLGKTAISIHAADLAHAKTVLIVCPAIAQVNWERELHQFSPRYNSKELTPTIVSYQSLHKIPTEQHFDLLIMDEAHFVKNPLALRTKQIYGPKGIAHRCQKVWLLSGTPMPNNVSELWIHLFCLGYTKLSFAEYTAQFCHGRIIKIPGCKPRHQIIGSKTSAFPALRKILEPFVMKRTKEQLLDLPPITHQIVTVAPSEVELDMHESMVTYALNPSSQAHLFKKLDQQMALLKNFMATVKGREQVEGLKSLEMSLSTLRRFTGLQKTPAIVEMVADELENKAYEKIVIFAVHRDVVEDLARGLHRYRPLRLYGETSPKLRQKNIDKFQKSKDSRVMICNIHAAGTAITLTQARNILFAECTWTPAEMAQAVMRCHRIGQTKPVHVRYVALNESVDDAIMSTLSRKTRELTALYVDEERRRDDTTRRKSYVMKANRPAPTTTTTDVDEIELQKLME
jgi:SWI/SNF-related matrix-associated actin-dependent regulator 1 of chromatin subfamily A